MIYEVMFTSKEGERDFEEFNGKKTEALKFAQQKVNEGCTKVFLDIYDNEEDRNLIDYKSL